MNGQLSQNITDCDQAVKAPPKSNKPEDLSRAITRYGEVIDKASALLLKINEGQENPSLRGETANAPSLHNILTEGPKQLHESHDQLTSILADIDSALF